MKETKDSVPVRVDVATTPELFQLAGENKNIHTFFIEHGFHPHCPMRVEGETTYQVAPYFTGYNHNGWGNPNNGRGCCN